MRGCKIRLWGLLGLLLTGVGCSAGLATTRHAEPLTRLCANHTCADTTASPGILVADNPAQADLLWNRCRGRLVLGGGAEDEQWPEIDFGEKRLIYIHMGARRSGGFRLDLAGEIAHIVAWYV